MALLARSDIGKRVEIAPHLDEWMRGDRFGAIERVTRRSIHVRMDKSGRLLKFPFQGHSDHYVGWQSNLSLID